MAEAFIAISSAVTAGVGKAATSVASLFKGGAASGGAGGASTISNVLSVGSALSSIGAGVAGMAAAKEQAAQADIQAAQSAAEGAQRRAILAREYEELRGEQAVIAAAAGLNPGVGTPASIATATRDIADRNLSVSRENSRNIGRVFRSRRRSLMAGGRLSALQGALGAGQILGDEFQRTG